MRFHILAGAPLHEERACAYKNSPDFHFILDDRHPTAENLIIAGKNWIHSFHYQDSTKRKRRKQKRKNKNTGRVAVAQKNYCCALSSLAALCVFFLAKDIAQCQPVTAPFSDNRSFGIFLLGERAVQLGQMFFMSRRSEQKVWFKK